MITADTSLSPTPPPARRPRGRPRIFDETRRQTLCTLISIGLSRAEAARQVDVPPSSVVHAARTDPAFAPAQNPIIVSKPPCIRAKSTAYKNNKPLANHAIPDVSRETFPPPPLNFEL